MKDLELRLARAARAFINYNHYKQRIMQENDPTGASVILRLLPLLLHVNHPDLPGYCNGKNCPCGIKVMQKPIENKQELESFISTRISLREIQDTVSRQREIEGIYTIGSVGSVGQTKESDYDIWIVVDTALIGKERMELLERKLSLIRRWITGRYLLDLHFFIMDIGDIKANNFGKVSHEGAGSALKNLLKEEFYRTLTLIEGRIPLWWIIPPEAEAEMYSRALQVLDKIEGFHADEFIDMGNIEEIPKQELLGAALWQMHKALDDPLKSVLKMALSAIYLGPEMKTSPLCDILKRRVHEAQADEVVDPYIEAFRRVEDYYYDESDEKTVDLLRKCFYLKIGAQIIGNDLIKIGVKDKTSIIVDSVLSWEWSLKFIKYLNAFSEWDVEEYRKFGAHIHEYLKKTTVSLVKSARSYLVNMDIDEDVEIEVLRRRVEVFYVQKAGKIESEKRVKKKEPAYEELFFAYTNGLWEVYKLHPDVDHARLVMASPRVVKIVTWLVFNRRFDLSTAFHMLPNASHVFLSDIQNLLTELASLIPEATTIGLDRGSLLESRYIKHIIMIGNMERQKTKTIEEIDVVYLNSWNELFCQFMLPEELRSWIKKVKKEETKVSIWLPGEGDSRPLARSLIALVS